MKSKAHTRYRTSANQIVPGVTTITGLLNKPALVRWANNLGLKGIDSSKYTDELASIGTLAHYLIECKLKNETPNLEDYTPKQIEQAKPPVEKFDDWCKDVDFKVIASELSLVSDYWKFGGCCDIYAEVNGKKTLIDLKTSKAIYPEMITQVSAYKVLLEEHNHPVEEVRILRIGRSEDEGFDDRKVFNTEKHWQKFQHLLSIYEIDKELK